MPSSRGRNCTTLRREPGRFRRSELWTGLLVGIATGAAVLLLLPAMGLPAAVAFPVIQGISLLGGVLLTAVVFRERLNWRKGSGLLLGLALILLAVWR